MSTTTVNTSAEFADFTRTGDLVLVDFHASWCGPCKTLAPTVEQLGADFEGRVPVAKLDIEQVPEVAARYAIRSVPTLMLFREGKAVGSVIGVRSRPELKGWISGALAQAG